MPEKTVTVVTVPLLFLMQDARSVEDALKAAKRIGATLRDEITSHISKHHL